MVSALMWGALAVAALALTSGPAMAHYVPFPCDKITGYLIDPAFPNARDICGFATTYMGELVRFRVRMEDNGEGSKASSPDRFGFRLSNGYLVTTRPLGGGGPGGGNIQLHKPNPSTTGPVPPPTEYEMCGDLTPPGE